MKKIVIYTDGASKGNPGAGASAFIVLDGEEQYELKYQSIFYPQCTNNYAELSAILEALKYVKNSYPNLEDLNVIIKSDSEYCVDGCRQWMYGWKEKGTLTERPNGELWRSIYILVNELNSKLVRLRFIHVKGHSGVHWNEVADQLCNTAINEMRGFETSAELRSDSNIVVDYERDKSKFLMSETLVIDDIRVSKDGVQFVSNQGDKELIIMFSEQSFSILKMLLKS